MASKQTAARCMFCDALGATKAHVFAESWTKLFDGPASDGEHEVVLRYTDPVTGETSVKKRSKTFALWSRKVCGGCNSGWLREIEDAVLPTVRAFATDTPLRLDSEAQANLAMWTTIAAFLAMSIDLGGSADFINHDHPREIYRTRKPPVGTNVWVGANAHGEMAWVSAHSFILPSSTLVTPWGATVSFGYGVLHTICHGVPAQRLKLKGMAAGSLRRIWEPQELDVRWPPAVRMRPHDLTPLAKLIERSCVFERASQKRR